MTLGVTMKANPAYWDHEDACVLQALCGSPHISLTETTAQQQPPSFLAQTTSIKSCGADLKPSAILFPSLSQFLPDTLTLAPPFLRQIYGSEPEGLWVRPLLLLTSCLYDPPESNSSD